MIYIRNGARQVIERSREVDRETTLAVLTRAKVAPHQALRLLNQAHRDLLATQGSTPGDILVMALPRGTFVVGRWR
jgi:hypothetical protein